MPFITSSLQQAASSHLKLSPDTTMKLAQHLYENGHITYMRTDSPTVSPEGQTMAKAAIRQLYGDNYVGSTRYAAKGNAQEAHECIRPTDTDVSPETLRLTFGKEGERTAALYELIYKRFLASQMTNAIFNEVLVSVVGGAALFSAKGSQLAFDGFLRVYGYTEEQDVVRRADEEDEEETPTNKRLPRLKANEPVQPLKLIPQQHFTKPPAPYTEALLIKALEQNGVGRPSTYAQTVATIKQRGYVDVMSRKLAATPLGKEVHQVLSTKLPGLFETSFTAGMETTLDEIAAGKQNGRDYLHRFWTQVSSLFGHQVISATLAQSAPSTGGAEGAATTTKRTRRTKSSKTPRKVATAISVPVSSEHGTCPKCSSQVSKWMTKRRHRIQGGRAPEPPTMVLNLPNLRTSTHLISTPPDRLSLEDRFLLEQLRQDTLVDMLYSLVQRFRSIIGQRQVSLLDDWLEDCSSSKVAGLENFATSLKQDYAAVRAALEQPWSNGQIEGQVHRLKVLKRQMYGRAKLDLLRLRILYSP